MVDIVDSADPVVEIEIHGHGGDDIVHRDVFVVQLVEQRLDGLFDVRRHLEVLPFDELVISLAGEHEAVADFPALFVVLLVFGLLLSLRRFGLIFEIEQLVDSLSEFLGDFFHAGALGRLVNLSGEHEGGIIDRP